jgi:hypothetical protein
MICPPLPITGFISGRSATVEDISQGNAVFCLHSNDGSQSRALDILIPQYALCKKDGEEFLTILVQAEAHIHNPEGDPFFGLRTFDGGDMVALGREVVLLGRDAPNR